MRGGFRLLAAAALLTCFSARAQVYAPVIDPADEKNPFGFSGKNLPREIGVDAEGGVGLTESRNNFRFFNVGVHAGKVLRSFSVGNVHTNFEYGVEVIPFWQSYTPVFQRANCVATPTPIGGGGPTQPFICSALFNTGGTYTGSSITPIILKINLATRGKLVPFVQGAGGVIWTNHKYPGFPNPGDTVNLANDGPGTDASVWNFTPQFGVGFHYFVKPRRSIDFHANAIHISSASLGDKNPGVNASVQFQLGYSWWK